MEELQISWYRLRTPVKPFHHIVPGEGLSIYGNAYRLLDNEAAAMLLQKQTVFNLDWSTELTFEPTLEDQEAGTTVWVNRNSFASIGIRQGPDGQRQAIVRYSLVNNERYSWLPEGIPLTVSGQASSVVAGQ